MIDKKQLIEDLLECVNDATDTQTAMTGMTMCAMLMNEVIDQALILPDVRQQRELLAFLEILENMPRVNIPWDVKMLAINKYLKR